jgi:2-polyprenyl-6-methoxyphenol hydroxylase-like FAD-dependent oxidoreductase
VNEYDAIVVGARCGGSTLANALARRDWSVLLVDKDEFPSTTVSTHGLWPPGLARLDQFGVLDRLLAKHELPMYQSRIRGLGHEVLGGFTAVDGFEHAAAPRRIVLDEAGVEAALAAGATGRFGDRVVELIGAGSEEDPVQGVVLENGDRIKARWVLGADGRASTVARSLGLPKERPMRGEMSFAYAYWRGIPDPGYGTFHIELDRVLTSVSVEDDLHMLIISGPPEMVRGSKAERKRTYLEYVRRFPETISQDALDRAELVTDVVVAPESLMRGFFRKPAGPGWALVGDACHFKHPGTAQGIGDALEQAVYVAEGLSGADPQLEGYEAWRDDRAGDFYEWSFAWGHFPRPENEAIFRGLATEPEAGQDLRDTFSRLVKPSALMSQERLGRWFGDVAASA